MKTEIKATAEQIRAMARGQMKAVLVLNGVEVHPTGTEKVVNGALHFNVCEKNGTPQYDKRGRVKFFSCKDLGLVPQAALLIY